MSKLAFLLGTTTFVSRKLSTDLQSQPVWIFRRPRKLTTNTTSRTTTGTQHFHNLTQQLTSEPCLLFTSTFAYTNKYNCVSQWENKQLLVIGDSGNMVILITILAVCRATLIYLSMQPDTQVAVGGGLAQLVVTLVGSTKLLYAGPG